MKPILATIFCFAFIQVLFAQNAALHYQGVARNAQGAPLAGSTIAVRLSIKDAASNGSTLYSETKSIATNAFGLYSITINDGNGVRTGDFNSINWAAGTRFLQTEIDLANGTAFVDMGTQQMRSVPHAVVADNLRGVFDPGEGAILEFTNGQWRSKPKTKRYNAAGLGLGPASFLNFLGPTVTVIIEHDNPTISLVMSKSFGSVLPSGGQMLTLNLGYQKAGEGVQAFNIPDAIGNLRVAAGNRILFTRAGSYQTDFKAGATYTIGLIGFSTNATSWNDNGPGAGYVEVSY
jgi:hypothetical protein